MSAAAAETMTWRGSWWRVLSVAIIASRNNDGRRHETTSSLKRQSVHRASLCLQIPRLSSHVARPISHCSVRIGIWESAPRYDVQYLITVLVYSAVRTNYNQIDIRTAKFLEKFMTSDNYICSLFECHARIGLNKIFSMYDNASSALDVRRAADRLFFC